MVTSVAVKLYATLRKNVGFEPEGKRIEVPEGTTVEDLIAQIGVAPDEVWLVFVNAAKAEPRQELKDGDKVDIFPPVAGG